MSYGQGMALSYSWKQKIMTESSTEAELVRIDNTLGYILWTRYFMQEQGYDMDASLLYQDNMSTMLLKTNGKASSSKRTNHIKVKYNFVKHKINHCRTLSHQANVDRYQNRTKARSGIRSLPSTCHGHPSGLQGC